ncbi:TerD family protein [Streptomyces sp. IMTB 1903]|uniref:TerD family protein n=1 Tax=Streptomyces sp. IMTB 1903 TaxID=1776680 RepID=UPI000759C5E0|nr:TerD family protein [Streptomyces sp. IMTB 1903]
MRQLAKGGNTDIGTMVTTAELHSTDGLVTFTALVVGPDGVARSEPCAAVRALPAGGDGEPERIEVDPAALPADADRVVLVAQAAGPVPQVLVRALQEGAEPIEFRPPPLTGGERALLLAELYRRGPAWKLRAIGQGYADGTAGLAADFGLPPAALSGVQTAPAPSEAAPPPAPAGAGAVSLDKGGRASISLAKQDTGPAVTATLEWDGGSDRRRRKGADLDLYALFVPAARAVRGAHDPGTLITSRQARQEAKDPAAGEAVSYEDLGSLTEAPFIRLDGDAKEPGAETVRIARPAEQGYVLFCAYSAVSNGFGSFRSFGARVVVSDGCGSTVTVPLFEDTKTRYWVAIALADFTTPGTVALRHIEAYSGRMTERRPVLHADGTIEMNAGPVKFKGR